MNGVSTIEGFLTVVLRKAQKKVHECAHMGVCVAFIKKAQTNCP
jgi:hypothetical protein